MRRTPGWRRGPNTFQLDSDDRHDNSLMMSLGVTGSSSHLFPGHERRSDWSDGRY